MKVFWLGWLLKGKCDVTVFDNLVACLEVFMGLVLIGLAWGLTEFIRSRL